MPFDFDAAVSAPFRMQSGLRRIAPGSAQLTPNIAPERGTAVHLREKLAVFQAYPSQALLALDGFDATPALNALAQQAAREQPQAFALGSFEMALTGRFDMRGRPSWRSKLLSVLAQFRALNEFRRNPDSGDELILRCRA